MASAFSTPVGLSVAVVGIVFIGAVGWRLVPTRERTDTASFDSGAYLSEVRIVEGSKAVGKSLSEAEQMLDEADAQVVGMVRQGVHMPVPNSRRILAADDILVVEVEPESLATALSSLGLKLEEDIPAEAADKSLSEETASLEDIKESGDTDTEDNTKAKSRPDEVVLQELVVMPDAMMIGRSAKAVELRTRYGINLLALSRQGRRSIKRLRSTPIQAGDVLLLQGAPESISGFASIAESSLALRTPRRSP